MAFPQTIQQEFFKKLWSFELIDRVDSKKAQFMFHNLQIAIYFKNLLLQWPSISRLIFMHLGVLIASIFIGEILATFLAQKRLHAGMYAEHVPLVIVQNDEFAIADRAVIFAIIGVDFHVSRQMARLQEVFQANAALEVFLAGVTAFVPRQTDRVAERFATDRTLERLFPLVDHRVNLEVVFVAE